MKKALFIFISFGLLFSLSSCKTTSSSSKKKNKKHIVNSYIVAMEDHLKKNPDDVYVRFDLGSAYFRMQEFEKAKKFFSSVLKVEQARWDEKAFACVRIAKIGEMKKNYKKALKWYKKGLKHEDMRGTYVVGNYGMLLEKMEMYREALIVYDTVLGRKNLTEKEWMEFQKRKRAIQIMIQIKGKGKLR